MSDDIFAGLTPPPSRENLQLDKRDPGEAKIVEELRAFGDILMVLDKAVGMDKGIIVYRETRGQAIYLKQRINIFRKKYRILSTYQFDSSDDRYGTSPYDNLEITIREFDAGKEMFPVEIRKFAKDFLIEELLD